MDGAMYRYGVVVVEYSSKSAGRDVRVTPCNTLTQGCEIMGREVTKPLTLEVAVVEWEGDGDYGVMYHCQVRCGGDLSSLTVLGVQLETLQKIVGDALGVTKATEVSA